MTLNRIILIFLLPFIFACNQKANPPPPIETPATETETPPPVEEEEELTPISSQVSYAVGWTEMIITANYAKTTVTTGAHFGTSRNACGKDAYGAIQLEVWNSLADNVNLAIEQEPSREEHCVSIPEDNLYLNRTGLTVDLKMDNGNRSLFEIKDGQICTAIKDHDASKALIEAINSVIIAADKEECPNGWGS